MQFLEVYMLQENGMWSFSLVAEGLYWLSGGSLEAAMYSPKCQYTSSMPKALPPGMESTASSMGEGANGSMQLGLCVLVQQRCARTGTLFLAGALRSVLLCVKTWVVVLLSFPCRCLGRSGSVWGAHQGSPASVDRPHDGHDFFLLGLSLLVPYPFYQCAANWMCSQCGGLFLLWWNKGNLAAGPCSAGIQHGEVTHL